MKNYILHLENFLKVEKATVELKPGLIGLVGKNAQGKTSILTALSDLLQGKNDFTKIRDGAERAVVKIDVVENGELISTVSRVQTKNGMKMEGKGLRPGQTAAGFLATMFDEIAVNPVKLATQDPVGYLKQHLSVQIEKTDFPEDIAAMVNELALFQGKETVVKETGFDLAAKLAEDVAANRLLTNKKIQQEEAVVADMKRALPAEQPAQEFDKAEVEKRLTELKEQHAGARETNARAEAAEQELAKVSRKAEETRASIEALKVERQGLMDQIGRLDAKIETFMKQFADLQVKDLVEAQEKVKANPRVDTKALEDLGRAEQKKLEQIESIRLVQQGFKNLFQREATLKTLKDAFEKQDKVAKFFKYELPKRLIQKCKLPVEGIEFVDGAMHVGGRPLDKLSTAERAIVTTKLAMAIAKQKGHIAIALDGVEYLDDEHRAEFLKAAEESGMCIIYTRMAENGPEYPHEKLVENGTIVQ